MTEIHNPIPAEEQINFLQKIQTLFEDSSFNATYKFALLITLTDLSIELGNDSGNELKLTSEQVATRFAELYWPQKEPYSNGFKETGILNQNKGAQAEIITTLLEIQQLTGETNFSNVIKKDIWNKKIKKIIRTVWENPVFYLQEDDNQFIFSYSSSREFLTLTKQAHYCLRKFSEYIGQYAKNGWMTHLKTNQKNQLILSSDSDLESFLFGTSRSNLGKLRPYLLDFQNGKCFYCMKSLKNEADVDHFIPWKKYSRNLAENLVLSCHTCNRSKSDMLAGLIHLDKWLTKIVRNKDNSYEISKFGFISDPSCCVRISHWAYSNGEISKSHAWIKPSVFEEITEEHKKKICF